MQFIYTSEKFKNIKTPSHIYINDEELTSILKRDIKNGKISEELANYFILIFEKIISSHKYSNYTELYKEEFFDKALHHFFMFWYKFDTQKTQSKNENRGAYTYITTIIITSIHQCLLKFKRRENIKEKIKDDFFKNPIKFSENEDVINIIQKNINNEKETKKENPTLNDWI